MPLPKEAARYSTVCIRRTRLLCVLLVALIAVAGRPNAETANDRPVNGWAEALQRRPAPGTPVARPVPFAVGETLSYDVSWSSALTAGTAIMSVRERKPSNGSQAYYLVAEGQPTPLLSTLYNLYYKADSLLDVYTLLPQRSSIFSAEGKRRRTRITTFDHGKRRARYDVQTATLVTKTLTIEPGAQDGLGAIYRLRAMPLKQGDRFSMPVCDGGESYKVQVTVGGAEMVKTGIGDIRAWRITPVLPSTFEARRLTLWISDDARKLPVRMQAQLTVGSFDLTLKSAGR